MGKRKKGTLTIKNVLGYGLGDFGGCMTFAILGSFLTPYYTEVAGLSAGSVAIMYLILKVWDAINDPLMGALMDKVFAKTHSEKGKFRPWMIRATPLLAICSILMWTAPTYVNGAAKVLTAFVTYLLYEASYTIFNIPYGSLLSAMAKNDEERASLSSARGIGGFVGSVLPATVFPVLIKISEDTPQIGYTAGVTVCAVIGFISCMLCCKWTTENKNALIVEDVKDSSNVKLTDILVVIKKNTSFVGLCFVGLFYNISQYIGTSLGVYMYRDVLGNLTYMSIVMVPSMIVNVAVMVLGPTICSKFGVLRTVRVSQILCVVSYAATFGIMMINENVIVYMVMYCVSSALSSMTALLQWGMLAEVIDYNEMITGKRTEGSIYGTYNLTRRIGQALGSSAAIALLGMVGYIPNAATQTVGTITGIKVLVILMPGLFMALCWVALKLGWKITPEIQQKIADAKTKK